MYVLLTYLLNRPKLGRVESLLYSRLAVVGCIRPWWSRTEEQRAFL